MHLFSEAHQYSSAFSAVSVFWAPICLWSTARTGLFPETNYFFYSAMRTHFQIRSWGGNTWSNWQLYPDILSATLHQHHNSGWEARDAVWADQKGRAWEMLQVVLWGEAIALQMCLERSQVWAEQSWHGWRVHISPEPTEDGKVKTDWPFQGVTVAAEEEEESLWFWGMVMKYPALPSSGQGLQIIVS